MISRALAAIYALFLLSLLSACATAPLQATTDFDDKYDFSGVKTIAITPFDRSKVSSVTVSDMQVERINEAIASELSGKGYQIVSDPGKADLDLTWHLVTESRTDVRTYDGLSYYNCWRCGPAVSDVSVRQYTQGTFIVDMIDPSLHRSVWRSIIQSELKAQPDQDKAAERRKRAAASVFAQFPPGG